VHACQCSCKNKMILILDHSVFTKVVIHYALLVHQQQMCASITEEGCLFAALSQESPAGGSAEPEMDLRLGDIALALQGDWLTMATELGITNAEIIRIQKEFGNVSEQVSDVR